MNSPHPLVFLLLSSQRPRLREPFPNSVSGVVIQFLFDAHTISRIARRGEFPPSFQIKLLHVCFHKAWNARKTSNPNPQGSSFFLSQLPTMTTGTKKRSHHLMEGSSCFLLRRSLAFDSFRSFPISRTFHSHRRVWCLGFFFFSAFLLSSPQNCRWC